MVNYSEKISHIRLVSLRPFDTYPFMQAFLHVFGIIEFAMYYEPYLDYIIYYILFIRYTSEKDIRINKK